MQSAFRRCTLVDIANFLEQETMNVTETRLRYLCVIGKLRSVVQISQIFLKHFADAEFDVFCLRDMAFEIPGEVQRATDKCPSINVVCSNSGEWRVRPKPDRGEIPQAFTVPPTHCFFPPRATTGR